VRRAIPLVLLLGVAVVVWFLVALYQPFSGDGKGAVTVRIPNGASAGQIGDVLADRGVIGSSFFFGLRARLSGERDRLKAGTFRLRNDMSYAAAIDALTKNPPPPKTVRVTVPEGLSIREAAPLVQQAGLRGSYQEATRAFRPQAYGAPKSVKTLEGFLFPATYDLKPGTTARALVRQQLRTFKSTIAKVDLTRARKKNLSRYDVLTIASMIEREASVDADRKLISAVIYNRLKQGMPLGIDATIRYSLRNWSRPLRVSELNRDTPYNTRRRTGLPPTPIGNPGLASIQAAANPAKKPYLYYVVKPCGNGVHAFSATDQQFQKDVNAYNAARAKRGGDPSKC
jgi:uncharacterized YceG family protein